jgi:hypothetical protein
MTVEAVEYLGRFCFVFPPVFWLEGFPLRTKLGHDL